MSILKNYEWPGKYKPFAHQEATADFLSRRKKAFCFNEQGTGKTASVIWAADHLMKQGKIKRVLVICPLSIMKSAWQRDLFTFAMHRSCMVAYGDAKTRAKTISGNAEFVIINYDGVAIVKKEIMDGGFDLVVVDEANAYKNTQTNRWKALRDIVSKGCGLWMLTGTPAAQSPIDAFGLARLVNPDNSPKYVGAFRDMVMYRLSQYTWIPKPSAKDTVHNILQPAIRFEKKDCLDLPAVTFVNRDVELTAQQKKYYTLMQKQFIRDADGDSITAINAAAKLNKLLQISGGAVYSDNGAVVEFDASSRIQAVIEAINETNNKALVFVPFSHTIDILEESLNKSKIPCSVIDGRVSLHKRSEAVRRFQEEKDPKVLLIQPQAASHGLTLTAADTVIWYAPVTSVETYLQANARIDRPGQKNAMTVIHIVGSEVERKLYRVLRKKMADHKLVVDLYRDALQSAA